MKAAALLAFVFALAAGGCGASGGDDAAPGQPPPAAGTPGPGGGLTVREALETDADGPLMVRGTLIAEGDDVRLCYAVAESYPPQCGRPWLRVEGLDLATVDGLQEAENVRWTEREVSLLGDVEGDVLRVSKTSI